MAVGQQGGRRESRFEEAARGKGRRVPKSIFVEQRTVTLDDGTTVTVDLFACDGAIGIATMAETGEQQFDELVRVRTQRRVRLHGNADDDKRRFNRTENIRPIPATDPDFAGLCKRRNDAESINRALDDTLWLRRAHSIGHARQHLSLLTFALGVNSLALHRHRGRSSDPPTTQAAA
jgi:hypothetical protein